jgi:2-phospho-L-lactate guanylyltransferase
MRVIAVPVKSLSSAKRRLSPVLSPLERAALTLAMLEDVLDAALSVAGWETWVVSPDEAVLEVAARRGAKPVVEERGPLSAAVRQVEEEVLAAGSSSMLAVVLADLPYLSPKGLASALQTLGPVVLAPATTDGGTNLLLRRPPRAIPPRFGRNSYQRHLDAAAAKELPVATVTNRELALDLDTPEDLSLLMESGRPGRTLTCAHEMDAESRLAART